MALVKCSECGSDVSDLAKSCPKCGAPVAIEAPTERGHGCLVAILMVVAVLILTWIFSSNRTPSDTQTSGESFTPASSSAVSSPNPVQDRLMARSVSERNAILARLMQSSGERCQSVTRSMYQGQDSDHNAYWSLACENRRREYQLMIYADANGSTRYLDCAVGKALFGSSGCWKAF